MKKLLFFLATLLVFTECEKAAFNLETDIIGHWRGETSSCECQNSITIDYLQIQYTFDQQFRNQSIGQGGFIRDTAYYSISGDSLILEYPSQTVIMQLEMPGKNTLIIRASDFPHFPNSCSFIKSVFQRE